MKLSICMMIKNEEKNLRRCLEQLKPLTELGLAELIIVDTGSEDNSIIIAKEYTDKVYFHKWNKNFSEMRNISISYAKGEWIFIIDADERLDDAEKLIELVNSNILEKYNSVTIKVKNLYDINNENKYNLIESPRIFKNDGDFRYEGVVHNQPIFYNPILNSDISLTHFGYITDDKELMDKKFSRTVELLKLELDKEPNNIYYMYQLGISYDMHKEPKEALNHMRKTYSILSEKSELEKRQYIYIYSAYARIAYNNAEFREVLTISREGLRIEKDYIDFYYLAGMAEKQLKNEENSIVFFESYLKLYKKFNSLKISKDLALVMYHIYDDAKSNICFNMFNYYFNNKDYDKAYSVYKDITNINEKIYASTNILVYMEKCSELKEFYGEIKLENDKNIFLYELENKINKLKDNKKNNFYRQFSLNDDVYGKFNKIRIADNSNLKIELTKKLIKEIDFNKEPIFYSEIFENIKDNIKLIIDILKKLKVSNLKNIAFYLIDQKGFTEIFENYILEDNKDIKNAKDNKVFITVANVLMLFYLRDNNKVSDKYLNIFKLYVYRGMAFIKVLYRVENAEEIYKNISDPEDRFLVIMYIFNKLMNENDKKAAIKYMIEAVNTYEAFSKYIDIFKDEIFNLEEKNIIQEKNKEFENYKFKVKENINVLINQGSFDEAKKLISEYEEIVSCDLEVYSMKAIIYIMENKFEDAQVILKNGLEIDRNNFDLLYNLAFLYEKIEEYDKAIKYYTMARENCRDYNLETEISQIIDKIKVERPDIVIGDKNNEFENYKIRVKENINALINQGNLEEAKNIIAEYEEIVSNDLEIYSMKAVIYILLKKFKDAESILKSGLGIDENNFDLNYNLAYLYEQTEKLNNAIEYYNKAEKYCEDYDIKQNINYIIENIIERNSDLTIKNKQKIAFFVKQGMDSFLEDIIDGVSKEYETKKIIVNNYTQIDEGMEWADICWFEWCDELVQYGSKYKLAVDKKIICRLHSYEAFAGYPNNVNWNVVNTIIFVGENIKEFVIEKYKIDENKIVVIPNGVDINRYAFKERKAGFNIAYVGYINYKKGPMLLLHTFKAIYDKDHRYKLYIAGQFQDERDVLYFEQMIKEFGMEKNVIYEGWQDNLDNWLENKNYILCTSVLESQNMSVMQAMCKGIKPIIHDFVGAKQIYKSKYVWNSIDEAVKMITEKEYYSKEYTDFILNNFSLQNQNSLILNTINELRNIQCPINKQPLVTVGIINYNYEKYLDQCINSVLNQNYKNIDIIVIDDFSTDESKNIIKKYENNFENIRAIYHSKNSGSIVQGVQEIIREAKGEYFTFLSADDFLADQNVVEKYVLEFLLDEELDYVYGNIKPYNEFKNENDVWKYRDYTDDEIVFETFSRKGSGIIPFSVGLFKKEFYDKNKLTWIEDENNRVAGDTLNTLINLKHGWKRKYIDYNIICYRQHDNNMTYDLENRIKSIISVLEYIVNNFSETKYLKNINWDGLNKKSKECKKNYLIGLNYYDAFTMYLSGNGLPWKHEVDFDVEQIIVFLQPLINIIEKYMKKSLNISRLYSDDIKFILNEINKYKINISINKGSKECILQSQIVCKGKELRKGLLENYKERYKRKKIKLLIYSPSNGYWKYSFQSWKQCLNYMGIEVDVIYEISSDFNYSYYDGFITIAENTYINNSLRNEFIYNIKNKIGIVSKQHNNEELDLINIQLCKKFNFKFLISSLVKERNSDIFCNWTNNGIKIVNAPFGFNPITSYPEDAKKIYDYFLVGSNSYLKFEETEKYVVPILNQYKNGILRGTGWGNGIPELNPNNSNFFYNRSKVNLNYHLDIQKKKRTEVNERTFIIASCGAFQLIDNPNMICEFYSENHMAIARDEYEYIEKFKYYLDKPLERLEKSYNALVNTYEKDYSLFNRLDEIVKKIIGQSN